MSASLVLENRLQDLEELFKGLGSWSIIYQVILDFGKEYTLLAEEERSDRYFINSCSSPLWLKVFSEEEHLKIEAFSPGLIPSGLLGLVFVLCNDLPLQASYPNADYISPLVKRLGLEGHISPQRLQGFRNMLERIFSFLRDFENNNSLKEGV